MSEDNRRTILEMWESVTDGNFDPMEKGYHADLVYHGNAGEEMRGRAAAIDLARGYKAAFPDLRIEVELSVAEGDYVFTRVHATGTNTAELMGAPATGKRVDLRWIMNLVRFEGGKVVEEWEIFDQSDLMKQLGMA